MEQLAACLGESTVALAIGNHLGKLQSVEEVNRGKLFGGEDRPQQVLAGLGGGIRRSRPAVSSASDSLRYQFRGDVRWFHLSGNRLCRSFSNGALRNDSRK